jgi:hypothetical protein
MLVAQTYFPAIDGTAVLIQHLAEQSAARGDEVHVITTDALATRLRDYTTLLRWWDVRAVH